MSVDLRDASADDIGAMVRLHLRSFRAGGLAGPALLQRLESPEQPGRWLPRLPSVLIAEAGGDDDGGSGVVGFTSSGPAISGDWREPGTLIPGLGELYLIVVDPDRWRAGIGRRLLDATTARLAAAGYAAAVLWTHDGNEPAHRLYEAGGWAPDGETRTEEVDGAPVISVRYRRPLGS